MRNSRFFGEDLKTQDAGLKARRYNGSKTRGNGGVWAPGKFSLRGIVE